MKPDKHYSVKRKGTEPYAATRQDALAALWAARVEDAPCYIYTTRDPGAHHAKDLDLAHFPEQGTDVYKTIMKDFQLVHMDKCAGILRELLNHLPGTVRFEEPEGEQCVRLECDSGAKIEMRVTSDFVLRRQLHKYEVGVDTGEDYVSLIETPHIHEALSKFCVAAFGDSIQLRVRNHPACR